MSPYRTEAPLPPPEPWWVRVLDRIDALRKRWRAWETRWDDIGLAVMGLGLGAVLVAVFMLPIDAWAAAAMGEAPPSETTIPISTGAGGLGVGALGMWWSMHGRLKAAEKALEGIGPALPALVQRVETLVANLETLSKAMHEDGVTARGKIHDIRGILAKHDGRLIRLEERFNGLRDAVANGETSVPRPITDEPTGPVADTGRHRSVRDR